MDKLEYLSSLDHPDRPRHCGNVVHKSLHTNGFWWLYCPACSKYSVDAANWVTLKEIYPDDLASTNSAR